MLHRHRPRQNKQLIVVIISRLLLLSTLLPIVSAIASRRGASAFVCSFGTHLSPRSAVSFSTRSRRIMGITRRSPRKHSVSGIGAASGSPARSFTSSTSTGMKNQSPARATRVAKSQSLAGSKSIKTPSPKRKTATSRSPRKSSPARKKKTGGTGEDTEIRIYSIDLAQIAPENDWVDMNVPPEELRPSATLTTGQSFSWLVVNHDDDEDGDNDLNSIGNEQKSAWGVHNAKEWVGPLGNRVISIRETPTTTLYRVLHGPTDGVDGYLRDYFQLDTPLSPLYEEWSDHDNRLSRIADVIPGVRILRQDPVECLFSFICSSNNNVPRITKMLAAFREAYGVFMMELPCRSTSTDMVEGSDDGGALVDQQSSIRGRKLYSFPTLDALQAATDPALREMGLGYRASYIVETRDLLLSLGGEGYLMDLREMQDANQVQEKLIEFKGVGRKVADCVALFSLDQIEAIPVDTHVWHIACREYDPSLSEVKSLTPTIYKRVGDLFRTRFPSHAGWAHSLLFVAELPSFRGILPEDITAQMDEWRVQEKAKKAAQKEAKASKAANKK